ncbi:MAG: beta-ketoacyl-[acyl-carrier-protein] synthase family protein [Planctomycetota bacterium]|nr:beta-ketoacyl-[acyl-carrier-protein] synthase family protein [Planctomycetota bacterium]
MPTPRVLVTGMGAVSPHGDGVGPLWTGLVEGRQSFSHISLFDASPFRNPMAGEVKGYPVLPGGRPRAFRMLGRACSEAFRDALELPEGSDGDVAAGLMKQFGLKNSAVVAGTNFGGMSAAERALVQGETDAGEASLSEYLFGAASEGIASTFGLTGPRMNLSLSCASGAACIGVAFDLVRRGRVQAALACGYDELSLFIYAGLSALRAITPDTIRPFDKRRQGTLFSEGAGAILLENADSARRRKAPKIYAEIVGRAMNNDAYHMTAPEQEARGIQALMGAALTDAGLGPSKIDHINLHATGTPYNDKIETKAVEAVFGERCLEIPVCSVKSSIGHTMGAAGVIESIAAILSIREGIVPPVLGLDPAQQDPECGLRPVTGQALNGSFRTVLKTSYGFGGTNAAVVFTQVDA